MESETTTTLISAVFAAAEQAVSSLTDVAPGVNGERTEYAIASVLLEEAWIARP